MLAVALQSLIQALQNVNPVAFTIGPFEVRWYGLAYILGFLAAGFIVKKLASYRKMKISFDDLLTLILYLIIGVIAGGRLGYCLFYDPAYFLSNPLEIIKMWDGGMSFHGGFLGAILGGYFASRSMKVDFWQLADIGAVATPVGLGLGRVANFINGELWGRVTTSEWGVVFSGAGSQPRIPSQLIEALLEGPVLFFILLALVLYKPKRADGEIFGWLFVLYGVFRITAEFFREPDIQLGFLFGNWLTMGMLLSIPMIVAGAFIIARAYQRPRKK